MTPWNKGIKVDRIKYPNMGNFGIKSPEQRKRISDGHIGQKAWNKGKKCPQLSGKNNGSWKGDGVGYRGIHHWIKKVRGQPKKCQFCGEEQIISGKKIHWANKSGNYLRNKNDWLSLCAKCHHAYDKGGNNYNTKRICNLC
jgi:hypothetical protein